MSAKLVTTYLTDENRLVSTVELLSTLTNTAPSSDLNPAVQLTIELPGHTKTYVWVTREVASQLALLTGRVSVRFGFMSPAAGTPLELREILLPSGEVAPCYASESEVTFD